VSFVVPLLRRRRAPWDAMTAIGPQPGRRSTSRHPASRDGV
jgi:hypothetical protein